MAELEKYKARAAVEARNIEVIKTAIAEVDKRNLEGFQTHLAPEFKLYAPSNSTTPVSRDDYMAMVKMMTTAIPDTGRQRLPLYLTLRSSPALLLCPC